MSGKVICFQKFKNKRHKNWISSNESKINEVVRKHIFSSLQIDFECISDRYLSMQKNDYAESWDYLDLRDLISEYIEDTKVLDAIVSELKNKTWFDPRKISRQKILEMCLSVFILETGVSA